MFVINCVQNPATAVVLSLSQCLTVALKQIFRDPRWGRGQETPGEDPTINGEYAKEFVSGMQGNESSGYLKVSACLKHYAAYSEETGRESFAAVVTATDMEDTYLPAFHQGVTEGGASGLMCSYNAETYGYGVEGNGTQSGAVPSCANKYLMNDLARQTWGFNGYITSDCNAVNDVGPDTAPSQTTQGHNYTTTPAETVTAVLAAGMDTDCHGSMQQGTAYMTKTVMEPLLAVPEISALADNALKNQFRVLFRLGIFDPPEKVPWSGYGLDKVNTPAHQQLAREAADASIVLLKNNPIAGSAVTGPLKAGEHGSLPWPEVTNGQQQIKVAVLGRNANATTNMQGNYFGTAPYLISPLAGISKHSSTIYSDGSDIDHAVALVEDVDAVVMVVGLFSEGVHPNDEAEGLDRTSLLLPGTQHALISQVAAAAAKPAKGKPKPVAVVVMSGGVLDISDVKMNEDVGAIIWCGYPGQSGGDSIADILFGKVNPSGRTTLTWYPQEFVTLADAKDMHMRPNPATNYPGRSYRFYTGTPVFKFGSGLSYTSFSHYLSAPERLHSEKFGSDLRLSVLSKLVAATIFVGTMCHSALL